MTFRRMTMLAIVALAAGLFAWLRQPEDTPAVQAPAPQPPPSSLPAQAAARPPVRSQSLPALPDEPPLNVQVDRLLATHDPADAYRAYGLVADCATFNLNHDRIIFDQEELKHWKRDSLPGFRAMTEDEKQHDARLCSGLTERQRQSRLDYLATAAKAGVRGAAINFATEGPFGDPSALQTRPGDPLVQAWKATAVEQLTRAADSGDDISAIQYLGNEYGKDSLLVEKNPLLAYRYSVAWSLITEEMVGGDQNLASAREGMAGMVQDFSPEQRAAELSAARRIADLARAQREQAAHKPVPAG